MSHLTRNVLKLVGGGAVLIAAVMWLSGGCGDRIAPDDIDANARAAAASGHLAEVVEEDALLFERASGTVSSARHTTISSKILARIETIPVRAGDEVGEGDLVVSLDARDLAARLAAAREDVTAARAALELANSERGRIQGLFDSRIASRQQLDRTVAAQRVATANLERAQQAQTDAEVGASHAEIRSPVTGRVVDRLAEPGDTAAPGAPLLRIYDPGAMRLEAPIREGLATQLSPGQGLDVTIEALGLSLRGEVDEIVAAAEPGARTFLVKIRLPHTPRLFTGMFGRVDVPAGRGRRVTVAGGAIERIGQLEYVRVENPGAGVARRMVTTGTDLEDGRVEVLSGLSAGERVVVP